uniref:Reverse transcriptase domain-containing protein n=1 Tax=Tanacetum cinerariifolium TaxID=118510 RepID=A0A6L2K4H7_TANCI|nr:hypothetical protein [Tanacetum cinerariifolium]
MQITHERQGKLPINIWERMERELHRRFLPLNLGQVLFNLLQHCTQDDAYNLAVRAENQLEWSSMLIKSFPSIDPSSQHTTKISSIDIKKQIVSTNTKTTKTTNPYARAFIVNKGGETNNSDEDAGAEICHPEGGDYATIEYSAHSFVIRRILLAYKVTDSSQRHKLFKTRWIIFQKIFDVIIDNGSTVNILSRDVVQRLRPPTEKHLNPYKVGRIKSAGDIKVTERQWGYDVKATHKGKENTYIFYHDGVKMVLVPLSDGYNTNVSSSAECLAKGIESVEAKNNRLKKKEMQKSMFKMLLLVMLLKEMILLLKKIMLKNHPYHLLLYLLHHHNHLKIFYPYLRRVEYLEYDKVAQALEIKNLNRRVKKLEKEKKVRVLKLRRRRKGVIIRDPEEQSTTSSIIPTDTKSKDKGKGIMVEEPKPLKKKQQIEIDEEYARKLHAKLNKDIDWDVAIDYVKLKVKEAKRRKLNEEVEDLKRHLEIVPDKDDDVYTEATPLVRKVLVVDYVIIDLNKKPYYKIIRANGTHQLFISFLTLLKNFNREDLEALWSLVKERKAMRDNGAKKISGASCVEVNSRVHEFISGNGSHPLPERISKLTNLKAPGFDAQGVANIFVLAYHLKAPALEETGDPTREAAVYSYIAASLLCLFTKPASNYVSSWSSILKSYSKFYDEPMNVALPNPVELALEKIKSRFAFVSISEGLCDVFKCTPESIIIAMSDNLTDHETKRFERLLEIMAQNDENHQQKMWMYAKLFDETFMYHLQTKTCKFLIYTFAEALRSAAPKKHKGILHISQISGEFENEGFILDDLHDNEEDGQHVDDGSKREEGRRVLMGHQNHYINKLAERLNGYKPLAELAMEQPSPVSVVDAFYTEDPPYPI